MLKKIPKNIINEIRDKINIIQIIGSELDLKKRGNNYISICPFHNEKTPSFTVSEQKQIYHCFGCKESGDVFNFLIKYKNLSFYESIFYLAEILNINLSEYSPLLNRENDFYIKYKKYFKIMEFISDFYHEFLSVTNNENIKIYLKKRNLNDEIIKKFRIGFAPNKNIIEKLFKKNSIDLELAIELGLVNKGNYGNYFDTFKNRIIFPIMDNYGNIVGFSGRIFEKNNDKIKYLHSPENILFKKSNILFNFNNIKLNSSKYDKVYVCEGMMDVFSLYNINKKNSVCVLGSSLNIKKIKELKKYFKNIVIFFDNDLAGKKATIKIIKDSLKNKINIKSIFWKNNIKEKDIDEYLINNNNIDDLLKQEYFAFDYLIKTYFSDIDKNNNIEYRKKYLLEILKYLKIYDDDITTDFYIKKISKILDISYNSIIELIKKNNLSIFKEEQLKINSIKKNILDNIPNKEYSCELNIILYLLSNRRYMNIFVENWPFSKNELFRSLITKIIRYYEINTNCMNIEIKDIENILNSREKEILYEASIISDRLDEKYYLKNIYTLDFLNKKKVLREKILNANNEEEKTNFINQYIDVIKQMEEDINEQ